MLLCQLCFVPSKLFYEFTLISIDYIHLSLPLLKMDPAILDFTRIALEDNEVTKELCLFTFGHTV